MTWGVVGSDCSTNTAILNGAVVSQACDSEV